MENFNLKGMILLLFGKNIIKKNVEYEGVKYSIGVKFNKGEIDIIIIYNDKGKIKYRHEPANSSRIYDDSYLIKDAIKKYNKEEQMKLWNKKVIKKFNEWDGKIN
ncbi:hypothetical protein Bp8pS_179 [Bacillus phage vB_BpuM-BpSp]|nr:hypothetical protein Bp8pS_179 [Bacillus phage vB_BpuM-BpSp]